MTQPLVILAAGGTGGHLFPAEALAVALKARGVTVDLATDERAERYGKDFPARQTHIIPSATYRGGDPLSLVRTFGTLGLGFAKAWLLMGRVRPVAVVGFGGYPTLPPLMSAARRKIPTIIHDANAVMGRANKMLATRATAIATSFDGVVDGALAAKATRTGNPVRPAVIAAASIPYPLYDATQPLRLTVTGGSQGARVMSDVVPAAIETLDAALRARLLLAQQARDEDLAQVRGIYARLNIATEVAAFFPDLPARIAAAHLVVSRSGASTVSELAAIGRPSILIPLPGALDQDQFANAGVLADVGGAIRLPQTEFTPERLAAEVAALASAPQKLVAMAGAARSQGAPDAAERLADLVMKVAAK